MDYSEIHHPTGELFLFTKWEKVPWGDYELSSAQVQEYRERGYLGPIKVLTPSQCQQLIADYNSISNINEPHPQRHLLYEQHYNQTGDPGQVLFHALGHWRLTPAFHDLCFLPEITVPASQLIDGESHSDRPVTKIRLWHDQLFGKPAHHGGVVAWHQDYSYWTRTRPMRHLTVHVALDEQTLDNGCIHYVPGSHTWTRSTGGATRGDQREPLPVTDFNFKDMTSIMSVLTEEERESFKPVSVPLKPGEAIFHHPLTVHGSYQNKSSKCRRAAVVNYFADGVWCDSDEELLAGTGLVTKGEKLGGQFYPVVFDPRWRERGDETVE